MNNVAPSGRLFVISIPIGNDDDITLRAIKALGAADVVVCEEDREGQRLLRMVGIQKPLHLLNEHSTSSDVQSIVDLLSNGSVVALVSDAGTPLLADPGQTLIQRCLALDIGIEVVPGASSILTAVVRSGFDCGAFLFAGFVRRVEEERLEDFRRLASEPRTVILLEAPYRLRQLLASAAAIMPERCAYVGCNLTMASETHHYGTIAELSAKFTEKTFKGEFVVCIQGTTAANQPATIDDMQQNEYGRGRGGGRGGKKRPGGPSPAPPARANYDDEQPRDNAGVNGYAPTPRPYDPRPDGGRGARPGHGQRPRPQGGRGPRREGPGGPRREGPGPRPEQRGARPDGTRGPHPAEGRGPRPDNRGPRPDNRGPRREGQGQGPRPEGRGPRPDNRGPRPDNRGPRREGQAQDPRREGQAQDPRREGPPQGGNRGRTGQGGGYGGGGQSRPHGRPQGGRPQGAGQGRPQGAGQGRPQGAGQGRPQGGGQGRPQGGGQGRPHGRPQGNRVRSEGGEPNFNRADANYSALDPTLQRRQRRAGAPKGGGRGLRGKTGGSSPARKRAPQDLRGRVYSNDTYISKDFTDQNKPTERKLRSRRKKPPTGNASEE